MNPLSVILGIGVYFGIRKSWNDYQEAEREVNRTLPPVDYSRPDWREQAWRRSELRSEINERKYNPDWRQSK